MCEGAKRSGVLVAVVGVRLAVGVPMAADVLIATHSRGCASGG